MNNKFRYFCLSSFLLFYILVTKFAVAAAPITDISLSYNDNYILKIKTVINSQWQLLYKINKYLLNIQQDINILHGKIQENQYQLSKAIQKQKDIYIQLDLLNSKINSSKSNLIKTNNNDSVINLVKIENKKVNYNIETEKVNYNTAVSFAMKSKTKQQMIKAITCFQNFIKMYPKSDYQSNANYWLGQLNYSQGNKENAAFYFTIVIENYPNSPKVAESLYKIGLLMQEKGLNDKARAIYQHVIKSYPDDYIAKIAEKKLTLF